MARTFPLVPSAICILLMPVFTVPSPVVAAPNP